MACGPVLYAGDVVEAEEALERAYKKNAKWHAPFEYYSAEVYLAEARELAVAGRYEDAIRFAHTSTQYARRAVERSSGTEHGTAREQTPSP